jgi:hypothetical protein
MEKLPSRLRIHSDGKIGQGAFGSVYRVCQDDNCDLALKIFPKWYEEDFGECQATSQASDAGLAPRFHRCWSAGDEVLLLMDLHGISLPQYLAVETRDRRKLALDSFRRLEQKILERGYPRDPNDENFVIRECPDRKINPQVLAVDWTLGGEKKQPISLREKLLLQKRTHDEVEAAIKSLEKSVEWIAREPSRLKTARDKVRWLRQWENCQ